MSKMRVSDETVAAFLAELRSMIGFGMDYNLDIGGDKTIVSVSDEVTEDGGLLVTFKEIAQGPGEVDTEYTFKVIPFVQSILPICNSVKRRRRAEAGLLSCDNQCPACVDPRNETRDPDCRNHG